MAKTLKTWGEGGGFREGNWPRLKAAIEFQEVLGGGFNSCSLNDPRTFEGEWSENPSRTPDHFSSPAQYRAWRHIMISGLEAFSGQISRKTQVAEEGKDNWLRLRDSCKKRGFGAVHENNLLALRRYALKAGVSPAEVTKPWAESVQKDLEQSERAVFRAGVGALDCVRTDDDISRTFNLSREPIGQLEKKLPPNAENPLPPILAAEVGAWLEGLKAGEPVGFRGRRRPPVSESLIRQNRFAIAWYWRRFSTVFPDESDPEMALLAASENVQRISRSCVEDGPQQPNPDFKVGYFKNILLFLQRWNPQLAMPSQ
jgi:hypothetical protein